MKNRPPPQLQQGLLLQTLHMLSLCLQRTGSSNDFACSVFFPRRRIHALSPPPLTLNGLVWTCCLSPLPLGVFFPHLQLCFLWIRSMPRLLSSGGCSLCLDAFAPLPHQPLLLLEMTQVLGSSPSPWGLHGYWPRPPGTYAWTGVNGKTFFLLLQSSSIWKPYPVLDTEFWLVEDPA